MSKQTLSISANPTHSRHTRPHAELLAPVGRREHLRAAIDEGANAVYLGVSDLNARGERAQFSEDDLNGICAEAQAAGLRVYLTLNILLTNDELPRARALASQAHASGVSAVIVQDRGLAELLHRELPELELHASTQFSVTSLEALEQLPALGFTRVVAPRELTLPELQAYCAHAASLGLEVEAFVQGAMCISVSGQCAMSWAEGTRSANRGNCAQPCRLRYQLLREGQPIGREARLISPADMSRIRDLHELMAAGVSSFKIEGRLRSESYVRTALRSYRAILDSGPTASDATVDRAEAMLHTAFSRGPDFNRGYDGGRGRRFLSGERSGHYGLYMGAVERIYAHKGELVLYAQNRPRLDVVPGAIWSLRNDDDVELASAPIYHFEVRDGGPLYSVMLRGFHPAILRSLEGQRVSAYLMSYPQATAAAGEQPSETRGRLDFVLRETAPGTLALQATLTPDLAPNKRVTLEVTSATPEDYRSVLGPERVEKQLGKLGTTAYYPGEIQIDAEVRAPVSWLNALRRELIAALDEQLASSDTDEVPSAPTSSPAHTHTATVRQPTATLTPAPTSSAQPDSAQPPSARTTERLLDYLSWRGGRIDREVLARLTAEPDASPEAPQLDLLLLPLDKLATYGIPELPEGVRLIAELPVSLPFDYHAQMLDKLDSLSPRSIHGVVMATNLLPALDKLVPNELRIQTDFRIIAGPGSQVTNEASLQNLLGQGFTDIYLDDLVTRGEHDDWILALPERYPDTRFWVPGPGRSRNMTLRFCPVGASAPGCTLCLSHRYSIRQEGGATFDVVCERERDCSATILSTLENSAGSHLSPALRGLSQWAGEAESLPLHVIQ